MDRCLGDAVTPTKRGTSLRPFGGLSTPVARHQLWLGVRLTEVSAGRADKAIDERSGRCVELRCTAAHAVEPTPNQLKKKAAALAFLISWDRRVAPSLNNPGDQPQRLRSSIVNTLFEVSLDTPHMVGDMRET